MSVLSRSLEEAGHFGQEASCENRVYWPFTLTV
jgi:hypothetical protein